MNNNYFSHTLLSTCWAICFSAGILSYVSAGEQAGGIIRPSTLPHQNYIMEITPLKSCRSVIVNKHMLDRVSYMSNESENGYGTIKWQFLNGRGAVEQESLSAENKSLTSLVSYDALGRVSRRWLPVARAGTNGYMTNYEERAMQLSEIPYSESIWESSPLSRSVGEKGIGIYSSHPSSVSYLPCNNNEVKQIVAQSGQIHCTGYHAEGSLSKTTSIDPDGKSVTEYQDAQGRLIMQRQGADICTYYVYNDLNQLVYVLPPMLYSGISVNTTKADSHVDMKRYAYVYRYDSRGNVCYKRLPGADPIYQIYDAANRLVLSQDGNQRERGDFWRVYVSDVLGRMAYSVEMEFEGDSESTLRAAIEGSYVTSSFSLSAVFNGVHQIGYGNALPGNVSQMLKVSYYDSYDFLNLLSDADQSALNQTEKTGFSLVNNEVGAAKGLLTGERIYSLYDSTYTTIVYYYDSRDRLVQQHSTNTMGGYDHIWYGLSFTGNPLQQYMEHVSSVDSIAEEYTYTYDGADRLVDTYYRLGNKPLSLLSKRKYDSYGRLETKCLYGTVDSVVYSYDVNSRVTQIQTASGFQQQIYFGEISPAHTNTPYYNGNISLMTWTYGAKNRAYSYTYDSANRLSVASCTYPLHGDVANYSESFTYNKQGNITNLTRGYGEQEQELFLSYEGNQLRNVSSEGGPVISYGNYVYINGTITENEFQYDKNGNQIQDFDRKICTIQYNLLNLPQIIQFENGNQIVHCYNAEGNRYQTIYYTRQIPLIEPVTDIVSMTDLSGYLRRTDAIVGNKRYVKMQNMWSLDYVFNPEGYTRFSITGKTSTYYYIKDYLSNVRETYRVSSTGQRQLVQRTQYYPSGLPWGDGTGASEQPFKYNGKEFVEMHGLDEYDSEARWYYPQLMRTTTMDPLCEKYYSLSPYSWCANNPVRLIDPDGRVFSKVNDKRAKEYASELMNKYRDANPLQRRYLHNLIIGLGQMRKDLDHEYRFQSRPHRESGSETKPTGKNRKGQTIVNMIYTSDETKAHEVTHGVQVARGDIGMDDKSIVGYGLEDELAAYQTQIAVEGPFTIYVSSGDGDFGETELVTFNSPEDITIDDILRIVEHAFSNEQIYKNYPIND